MTAATESPETVGGPKISPPVDRRRRAWLRLEAFVERTFLLFCIYVLSLGPLYWEWVAGKYVKGSLLLAAFYEPLWILANRFPWLGRIINWYVWQWIS